MNNKKFTILFLTLAIIFAGTWTYLKAEGETISACIKKDGSLYVPALGGSCKGQDNVITWNIVGPQGPKGDKGDQGEQGRPATLGGGNIAFCRDLGGGCNEVLKKDGTIWRWNEGWFPSNYPFEPLPTSTENILYWDQDQFLDKNGDVWVWNNADQVWVNRRQP